MERGNLGPARRRLEPERRRLTHPRVPEAPRDPLPGRQEPARTRVHWGGARGKGRGRAPTNVGMGGQMAGMGGDKDGMGGDNGGGRGQWRGGEGAGPSSWTTGPPLRASQLIFWVGLSSSSTRFFTFGFP